LLAYAGLGLGRDLRGDTTVARFLELPGFDAIVAAHDANRAPLARSRIRGTLPDSTFWPEGMDYDSRTGNFYVASVRHRTVAELSPAGRARELWPRHQASLGAMLGVRVDPRRPILWVTTSGLPQMEGYRPADSAIAALLRVRLGDGVIERRWDLPPTPGGHVLGDLAIGPGGEVYLTDSNEPVLYLLRPGRDTLERITNPLFRSLQGLAPTPDGRALYLADYSHGLLRLDLRRGGVIRLADAPGSTSLGVDGIAWHRGAIVAVQNGVAPARVMRFVLDGSGTRIARAEVLDRNLPTADEPTIGAIAGSEFVYVANSQWEKYTEDGRRNGVPLAAPVLLAVPLAQSHRLAPRPGGLR
jgi:sugar lactone lactonase YvrE